MKSLRSSDVKRVLFAVSLALAMIASLGACCEEESEPALNKATAPDTSSANPGADAGAPQATPGTSEESAERDAPSEGAKLADTAAQGSSEDTDDTKVPATEAGASKAQEGEEAANGDDAQVGDEAAVAAEGEQGDDGAQGDDYEPGGEPLPEGAAEAGDDPATASNPAQSGEAPVEEKKTDGGKVEEQAPFEPGDLYQGPPSKAIVGRWRITVPEHAIPKGLPKEERERLDAMGEITMEFDGRQALVRYGNERERFDYKVASEKDISLQLSAQRDGGEQMIYVTFYDMDNILLNEPRYPGPARGARVKP